MGVLEIRDSISSLEAILGLFKSRSMKSDNVAVNTEASIDEGSKGRNDSIVATQGVVVEVDEGPAAKV